MFNKFIYLIKKVMLDEQKRAHNRLYFELVQSCEASVKRSLSAQESLVLWSMSNEQLEVLNALMKEGEGL